MEAKRVTAAIASAGFLGIASLASAQSTGGVTLYGRLNMTIEAVSGLAIDPNLPANAPPVNRTLYRVNSNTSRLGVRGSEALGGGLSAIFQIESTVQSDISGGLLASRETFVGLQGQWGTFKMGNYVTPYDDIHPIFGNIPTLGTSILSTANIWAQGSQNNDNGGFDNRNGNSIRYDSPRVGGFLFSQQISAYDFSPSSGSGGSTYGTDAQAKRHAYIGTTALFYTNGPLQAGFAYQWNQKVRGPDLDDYAASFAAAYNFGPVRVGGIYERIDYGTPTGSLTRNFWGVSGTIPIGPGEAYLFYGTAGDGGGSSAPGTRVGQLIRGSSTGAVQWEVSYTYAFSKRTLAYLGFVQIRNDANAPYNFHVNPFPVVAGANANGLVLGLAHFF